MKAFIETMGWVLFVFFMVGVLHVAAGIESNALKLQDMHHGRAE